MCRVVIGWDQLPAFGLVETNMASLPHTLYGSVDAHEEENAFELPPKSEAEDTAAAAGSNDRPRRWLLSATLVLMGAAAALATRARVGGSGTASLVGQPDQGLTNRIHDSSGVKKSAFTHALKDALTRVANSEIVLFGHEEDNLKGQHWW